MCLLSSLISHSVSPLSRSATVQLSPGHRVSPPPPAPAKLPACRAPTLASRPATKPVIVGLDLTGKLLLWDARLPPHPDAVVFAGVVPGRELPTLADFSSPQG